MPAEVFGPDYAFLKGEELLSFDELERLVRAFARLGVHKVRITGGEPLLRADLPDLVARLVGVPGVDDLALTTNGLLLPRWAGPLREAGLGRVTVSLDALDDAVSGLMNGRGTPADGALRGIAAAAAAGLRVKVNMVVQRGVNDGEILPMARHFRQAGQTLRFIEFMDVGNHNGWRMEQVVPSAEILARIDAAFPLEPVEPGYRGEVARRYRYKDNGVEVGFISSVTQAFCRDCTRARLSAEGRLYTCLFATEGWDFKEVLRAGADDEEIHRTAAAIWAGRADRYSELRSEILAKHLHPHKVEMSYIGG